MSKIYDAILFMSFGGPEGPDEVLPFLRNVVKGRNIPDERLVRVASHYNHFGGISPINGCNRDIIKRLRENLHKSGVNLPIYWGNRNWHPLIADTVENMKNDGIENAVVLLTSAYSSYSSCRQYKENIEEAIAIHKSNLKITKIRPYFNHPKFIDANVEMISQALLQFGNKAKSVKLIFTAHSVPLTMAEGCLYQTQLEWAAKTIAKRLNVENFTMAYQSRSGSPRDPWLEPDILDVLVSDCKTSENVLISPIGFISDHMEVVYDLDLEAKNKARELGLNFVRAKTASNSEIFIEMLVDLVLEIMENKIPSIHPDFDLVKPSCDVECCPKMALDSLAKVLN